jgi:hypothetical protein
VKNFAASVTDGFVAINVRGGNLAVTTQRVRMAAGSFRQMIVHAKQGGRWLRPAIISTPVATGTPPRQ